MMQLIQVVASSGTKMLREIWRKWHLPTLLTPLIVMLIATLAGCAKVGNAIWTEDRLVGTWQLVDRGDVGVPPLGERCEFHSDGTMRIYEGGQIRIGTFAVNANELEIAVAGAPVEVWVIRSQPGGELTLFSRSLNTTVRYVRVSRSEFITGTIGIILKSIIVIALIFLLYRFLVRVLELE